MAPLAPQRVGTMLPRHGFRVGVSLFVLVTAGLLSAGVVQLAYRTSPLVALAALPALGLVALAFVRPIVALYASVLLIPLDVLSVGFGGVKALTPSYAMFILTALGWSLGRLARGQMPFMPSPLTKPLGLMLAAIVPGLLVAVDPFAVMKVLVMWSTFFLIYQLLIADGREITVRRVLLALITSAATVGIIALTGAQPPELIDGGQNATNRAAGVFTNPNQLAGFAVMALPVALAISIQNRPPARAARTLALVSCAAMLIGLCLSLSRGGFMALAGALIVMVGWRPFRRVAVVAALAIGVIVLTGANPLNVKAQTSLVTQRVTSVTYAAKGVDPRLQVWHQVPQLIVDHLPLGVGAENFPFVASQYDIVSVPSDIDPTAGLLPFEHAHNIVLTVGAELGVLGLVALVWVTVALSRTLLKAFRRSPERSLVFGVTAGLTAFAIQGQVDYLLRGSFVLAAGAILAACAVILSRPVSTATPA